MELAVDRDIVTESDLTIVARKYKDGQTTSMCITTLQSEAKTAIHCGRIGLDVYTVFVGKSSDASGNVIRQSMLTKCDEYGIVSVVKDYSVGIHLPILSSSGQFVQTIPLYWVENTTQNTTQTYVWTSVQTQPSSIAAFAAPSIEQASMTNRLDMSFLIGVYAHMEDVVYMVFSNRCLKITSMGFVTTGDINLFGVGVVSNYVSAGHRLCQVQWSPPTPAELGYPPGTIIRVDTPDKEELGIISTRITISSSNGMRLPNVFITNDLFVINHMGHMGNNTETYTVQYVEKPNDYVHILTIYASEKHLWGFQGVFDFSIKKAHGIRVCSMDFAVASANPVVETADFQADKDDLPSYDGFDVRGWWATDGKNQLLWTTARERGGPFGSWWNEAVLHWTRNTNDGSDTYSFQCDDCVQMCDMDLVADGKAQILYNNGRIWVRSIYEWSKGLEAVSEYAVPYNAIALMRPNDIVVSYVPDDRSVQIIILGRITPEFVKLLVPSVKTIGTDSDGPDDLFEIQWASGSKYAIMRTTRSPSDDITIDVTNPSTKTGIKEEYTSVMDSPIFFVGQSSLCGLFSDNGAKLTGLAYDVREYLPYSVAYYQEWLAASSPDVNGQLSLMIGQVRVFNATYGVTTGDPYNRSVCIDAIGMLKAVFGDLSDSQSVRSLEPSAICFHEPCSKLKLRQTILGEYLRLTPCDINYSICIPALDAGNIQGSAVVIVNSCGGSGGGGSGLSVGIDNIVSNTDGIPLWASILIGILSTVVGLAFLYILYRRYRNNAKKNTIIESSNHPSGM
jgi:hypothetical protein